MRVLNKSKSQKIIIAFHKEVCISGGKCFCTGNIPATFHIGIGVSGELPNELLKSKNLEKLISQREILVIEENKGKEIKTNDVDTKKKFVKKIR